MKKSFSVKGISSAIIAGVITMVAPSTVLAFDPWLSYEGSGSVGVAYSYQTFDEFYRGTEKTDLPFGRLDQDSWILAGSYSLEDYLSIDLSTEYTETDGRDAGSEYGLGDSIIGTRTRLLDEFSGDDPFTLTGEANLVIPGSYDQEQFPVAPGDGAWAGQFGLAFGRFLGDSGLGLLGGASYRVREADIPHVWYFNAGLVYTPFDLLTLSTQYRRERAVSGTDIGGDDFDPTRPDLLKEISDNVEVAATFNISDTWNVSVLYAHTIDGRNTGVKDVISVFLGYNFDA